MRRKNGRGEAWARAVVKLMVTVYAEVRMEMAAKLRVEGSVGGDEGESEAQHAKVRQ